VKGFEGDVDSAAVALGEGGSKELELTDAPASLAGDVVLSGAMGTELVVGVIVV